MTSVRTQDYVAGYKAGTQEALGRFADTITEAIATIHAAGALHGAPLPRAAVTEMLQDLARANREAVAKLEALG